MSMQPKLQKNTDQKQKRLNKQMTNSQLCRYAYQTCCWWNAVFVQEKRFLNAYCDTDPNTREPWDVGTDQSVFIVEREFFIVSICNAVKHLERLNVELQYQGDNALASVLDAINEVTPLSAIKDLRDMNVHRLDYMMDAGRHQNRHYSTIKVDQYRVEIDPTITFGVGHELWLGNVSINTLLPVMKKYLPLVKEKTKEVYVRTLRAAFKEEGKS